MAKLTDGEIVELKRRLKAAVHYRISELWQPAIWLELEDSLDYVRELLNAAEQRGRDEGAMTREEALLQARELGEREMRQPLPVSICRAKPPHPEACRVKVPKPCPINCAYCTDPFYGHQQPHFTEDQCSACASEDKLRARDIVPHLI